MFADRCVCCGEVIPEGSQVCSECLMGWYDTLLKRQNNEQLLGNAKKPEPEEKKEGENDKSV